jgi:hypothetical protein
VESYKDFVADVLASGAYAKDCGTSTFLTKVQTKHLERAKANVVGFVEIGVL